ncbi:8-amino-7-oxononanoate synthase [Methylomagnum ishizawai]|uniref:8-amino-7-oxononanoate synthase n=1 Tax=Methylomagnum ishizawai TaxID=1760988 RepID=UPI001C322B0D|nr:8-amino-7-oxononanoate synthase [Methylomagnum ishizawai]BBL73371.1 8-amino-7-oxononanoate synthase [Methylomagnum ishizawai]
MADFREELRARLAAIERDGRYRRRRMLEGPQGVDVVVGGRPRVNFSGNDYLGLANHPEVVAALRRGAEDYGAGAGAAHLVSGHGRAHHALEEELAGFTGRERVLLFSTGYMANLGAITALAGRGDTVFEDRLNHASLLDGALLSGARLKRYPHADAAALRTALGAGDASTRLIVSDGLFSMDGDVAPVAELATVARDLDAVLMIDDAHGLGVLGGRGGGVLELAGLGQDAVPVLVGTLGKAFGTFGAFVAGCAELIEYLIQRARTYLYTTALPPAVAEAGRAALRLARAESWRREHLRRLIQRFRAGAGQLGLVLMPSASPIQPVVLGDNASVVRAGTALFEAGFLVGAIRPPTVPVGTARLRITLSAAHREEHVDGLLAALADLAAQPGFRAGAAP